MPATLIQLLIFITFETRDKLCSKTEKKHTEQKKSKSLVYINLVERKLFATISSHRALSMTLFSSANVPKENSNFVETSIFFSQTLVFLSPKKSDAYASVLYFFFFGYHQFDYIHFIWKRFDLKSDLKKTFSLSNAQN